jgi:hypothetical protein
MRINDILYDDDELCCFEEVVVCVETGEVLSEGAIRQFQRKGQAVVKKYRCTAGPKKGKLVATPASCFKRKDPKKVRQGRKTMRAKKSVIQRKSRVSKNKSMSKIVATMNQRMMGNT